MQRRYARIPAARRRAEYVASHRPAQTERYTKAQGPDNMFSLQIGDRYRFFLFIPRLSQTSFTRETGVWLRAAVAEFAAPNVSEFIPSRLQTPRSDSRRAQRLLFNTKPAFFYIPKKILHARFNQSTIRRSLSSAVLDGRSSVKFIVGHVC